MRCLALLRNAITVTLTALAVVSPAAAGDLWVPLRATRIRLTGADLGSIPIAGKPLAVRGDTLTVVNESVAPAALAARRGPGISRGYPGIRRPLAALGDRDRQPVLRPLERTHRPVAVDGRLGGNRGTRTRRPA